MIFSARLSRLVLAGKKTQTRRPVRPHHSEHHFRVGQSVAVQPGRGQKAVGRILLTDVVRQAVTEISLVDAVREGFRGTADFARTWLALYDTAYREALEHATDPEVLDRFTARFAGHEVWVLTFELDDSAAPRLLHRHSERGYTSSPRDAVEEEPEAIDEAIQHRITQQAHQRDEERLMAQQEEARRRLSADMRDVRLRMMAAERRARARGLDVRDEVRLAIKSAERIERQAVTPVGSGD